MNTPAALALASAGLSVLFALAWVLARRLDNYGLVDVAWSYAFALVAAAYALAGAGWAPRRLVLGLLVGAWSLRLGTHLARRVARLHPREDSRYADLRTRWGERTASRMFLFFQGQAVSVVILAVPFLLVARHPGAGFHPLEIAGVLVALAGVAGESIADRQLAAFKRSAAGAGGVCDAGLWRWSRHPNYFFEWLVWVGFALAAWPAPGGWLGLAAPLLILHLLLFVTGIPPTERQLLRSRGDAYRRYQGGTSAFLPWPPQRAAGHDHLHHQP